jgi:hypothetical protein
MNRVRRIGTLSLGVILAVACSSGPSEQRTFATPEEAAEALVGAAEQFDVAVLKSILGPDGVDLVVTEDTVQDKNQAQAFAALARQQMRVERDTSVAALAVLSVGPEDWPLPIPLIEEQGRWRFDSEAGRQEILNRRIGENELTAIDVCRGYVEAQHEYASERHDSAILHQYAQRILSTPGKHDGLAWQEPDGTWAGPVGEGIARVIAEGYTEKIEPYHGYHYKILKGQGPNAPFGATDFRVGGVMIGGFALVAAPADHGVSGIMTFIVSHDGIVYEKDLGPETAAQFRTMELYDPDETWTAVEESEES